MSPLASFSCTLVVLCSLWTASHQYLPSEMCTGTFSGLSASSYDLPVYLTMMRNRYAGCKKVLGNLEVVFSSPVPHALWTNESAWSFLNGIVEVTGYVLFSRTRLTKLPLTSLRLIGGDYLLQLAPSQPNSTCSLCLVINPALSSLGFQALTEISRGDVYVVGSNALEYGWTVSWDDLFMPRDGEPLQTIRISNISQRTGACHSSCGRYCFGPSQAECHFQTRLSCGSCGTRCLPRSPSMCCFQTCVGGCYNASNTGCVACQGVRNDGVCVSECPKRYVPDYRGRPVWNPNFKVASAGECLKFCPPHLVESEGSCFTQCNENWRELNNGTCVLCLPGEECPKYCDGNDVPKAIVNANVIEYMSSDSIKRFAKCTHVSGNININAKKWPDMTPAQLSSLGSVKVVTGYVSIELSSGHNLFTDYSFLGNLTTIHGRYLLDSESLRLVDQSPLTQLALRNLRNISFGNVALSIQSCIGGLVNWTRLFGSPSKQKIMSKEYNCAPPYSCAAQCDASAGCWGPTSDMCLACSNLRLGDTCVTNCVDPNNLNQKYYVDVSKRTCEKCHPECAQNCTGPNADQCVGGCRNFIKNGVCVSECGVGFWAAHNSSCFPCHPFCDKGCNGPHEHLATAEKKDGCLDCFRTIIKRDGYKVCGTRVTQCEPGFATDAKGADASISGVLCTQCEEGCVDCANNSRTCQVCESGRIVRASVPPRISALSVWSRLVLAGYSTNFTDVYSYNDTSFTENLRLYQELLRARPTAIEEAPCTQLIDENVEMPPGAFGCPTEAHGWYFMLRPKYNFTCVQEVIRLSVPPSTSNSYDAESEDTDDTSVDSISWETLNSATMRHCRSGDNLCLQCAPECRDGCFGPNTTDCNNCTFARIYPDDETFTGRFDCSLKCPTERPWRWEHLPDGGSSDPFCSAAMPPDERRKVVIIATTCSVIAVLIIIAAVVTAVMLRKRAHDKMKTRKFEREMAGIGAPEEPLLETQATPDMAKLRLIKLTELKRGDVIGSGAFGTVYRGLWLPEGESVKIPVAIKVLTESSARANAEFIEEVRVMATVTHPCCVRIAGVCMSEQPQLVTPLMRHGSLLDFLRQHESTLGARVLLSWSTQIALGMAYLEERGVVHRDLAARNVLVQSINQVKITDFGLAKLLDVNEAEYRAMGGKLPIKWLALECITERRFTHKSDVWAYGVTLWEMFTFGARPYDGTSARDMPDVLLQGERLPQPPTCSIDVYMVMLKCWMNDPSSRPAFRELTDEFARMSRDPGRFLHIETDKLSRPPTVLEASTSAQDDAILSSLLGTCGDDSGADNFRMMRAEDYLNPMGSAEGSIDSSGRVIMSALLARNTDTSVDTSAPPNYSAQFNLAPPPGDAPPPPPDAGLRYGALEAGKDRQSRLKNARTDSMDGRYAQDPVRLVTEIEREADRNRQSADDAFVRMRNKPDAAVAAAVPSKLGASNSRQVTKVSVADNAGQDYLEPRPENQPSYVEMRDQPRVTTQKFGDNASGRQTAQSTASNADTKPKVPAKAHDSVRTNLDILAPSPASISPINNRPLSQDDGDTYLVPPEARRSEAVPAEPDMYVNMALNTRGSTPSKPAPATNKATPSVAQNPDYFAPPSMVSAPKASVDEDEDDDDGGQASYINMDHDVERRLLNR